MAGLTAGSRLRGNEIVTHCHLGLQTGKGLWAGVGLAGTYMFGHPRC